MVFFMEGVETRLLAHHPHHTRIDIDGQRWQYDAMPNFDSHYISVSIPKGPLRDRLRDALAHRRKAWALAGAEGSPPGQQSLVLDLLATALDAEEARG